MGSASTLVHPGAAARQGRASRATGVPHWWRGLLLAALLGGSGAWVRGCHYGEPFGCERNDTAPEGTRFRVEVVEVVELVDIGEGQTDPEGCLALEPGSVFFLTAGETVEWDGTCAATAGSGAPEGLETEYEYARCEGGGHLGARCRVAHRELCPDVPNPGYVDFELRSSEFVLDEGPSEALFVVSDYVPDECAPRTGCSDTYRVRISRVLEE